MKYIEIRNSNDAMVIDDTYKNIKMSQKLYFDDLSDAGTHTGYIDPYNSFDTGTLRLRSIPQLAGKLNFFVLAPLSGVTGKIMLIYIKNKNSTFLAYKDGADVSGLKVFTFEKDQALPYTKYGLEVFDNSSKLIFSSAYKYLIPTSISKGPSKVQLLTQGVYDKSKQGIVFPADIKVNSVAYESYFYAGSSLIFPACRLALRNNYPVPSFRNIYAPMTTCDCSFY